MLCWVWNTPSHCSCLAFIVIEITCILDRGSKFQSLLRHFFNDGVQNIKVLRGDAAPRYLSCSGLCHYCRKGVSLGEGGSSLAEESRGEIHPRTGPPWWATHILCYVFVGCVTELRVKENIYIWHSNGSWQSVWRGARGVFCGGITFCNIIYS